MGDGRYYTYYQFFGILILVILSILALASMVVGYYRNSGNQNEKKMSRYFLMLSIIIILKIVEFVIPEMEKGLVLRYLISLLLINQVLSWIEYLNNYVLQIIKIPIYFLSEIIVGILLTITILTKGKLIISSYNFYKTEFTVTYLGIWIFVLLMILLYSFKILISKEKIHRVYQNKISFFILFIFLLIPVGLYLVMLIKKIFYLDFAEIFILTMLLTIFNIIMYSQSPFGITILTFNKIGDIISDYIFVTDISGKVIYKNSRVNQATFFAVNDKIDLDNLNKIYFSDAIEMFHPEGKEYFKMNCNGIDCYFMHRCDPIKNREETIGYIITIVDISELMKLLHLLEEMQEKAKETNIKLKNYVEVVYNVEREKEINTLLEKILSSREKDMVQLIKYIEELIEQKDVLTEADFQDKIDFLITYNQKILEEVRKTVNSYR